MHQPYRHKLLNSPHRYQNGVVALVGSLTILLLITVMTLVAAEIYTAEQRAAGNEQRERQSLENALMGMEHAIAYVADNGADSDGNGTADVVAAPASDPSSRASSPAGGTYAVELCAPGSTLPNLPTSTCTAATNTDQLLVYARGWSDDDTAVRHVVAVLEDTPGLANAPNNPLTTRGTAIINGSGDVTNPEGRSTIWSGQSVDFTNANFKTNILAPDGSQVIESSSLNQLGVDVIENDGNLSSLSGDAFFANFFGFTPSVYKDSVATDIFPPADLGSKSGTTDAIMWSEGDSSFSSNWTFGSPTEPVILIIDGNLDGAGNPTIYGVLYVSGDVTANGNITVNGAVIVQGDVNMTGSLDIIFDSSLLGGLDHVGQATVVPGSWKDWKEW